MKLFLRLTHLLAAGLFLTAIEFSEEPSRFAAGQFLVKLAPRTAEQVRLAEKKQNDGSLTVEVGDLPIREMRVLSVAYKVTRWQRLLPVPLAKDPSGLERIYLVFCDPSVDIARATKAFSALKEFVEYAEPDSIVRMQAACLRNGLRGTIVA